MNTLRSERQQSFYAKELPLLANPHYDKTYTIQNETQQALAHEPSQTDKRLCWFI